MLFPPLIISHGWPPPLFYITNMVYGYIRVSTDKQTVENQMAKLYGTHRETVKYFIKKKDLDSNENLRMIQKAFGLA